MRFGPYLKSLRRRAGLTQLELAQKCGLSGAYVNRLETQMADPPTRKVCYCLARALGVDGDEIWKQAFTARLERWLKKEGFKGASSELLADFFESLSKRG
jgi:transcriptional regulator with XRE-family HTH domain